MTTWTRRLGTPALGLAFAALCAGTPMAQAAERASKQETIGVVSGLTVGAAAAGPFGAIFGAAAGAWLGDRYHRQAQARAALAADLQDSRGEHSRLARELAGVNGSLVKAEARSARLAEALDGTRDLETEVGFRTGDATLGEQTVTRLRHFAALAVAVPGTYVRVSGHADPRGPQALNLALSERRAEAVARVLEDAGVPKERLLVEAHGAAESHSAEGDLDGYAFDRRVTLRLERTTGHALASRE